ncbi:hypothetical protein AK812_SmicGene45356 [Symbiodinium microadriaticum]|uniref:Uncharacterized protein n=1 Tax=Symbiodinium microadriaticum TaxID=2951 RepID=A0A1Q9BWC0_SYMMI|nr:hypothetical protein AK812_SmicGene45356 [Symbiodinium microadriaticum]
MAKPAGHVGKPSKALNDSAVQTAGLLVSVAGLVAGGGAAVYNWAAYPLARPIKRLSPLLRKVIELPDAPVVTVDCRPYAALKKDRALILQGRNKDGKTTLLRTSLPWWCRLGPWAHYGLYLNGEQSRGVTSFAEWQTTQLFGKTTTAGSEIAMSFYQYRERQWFRSLLQLLKLPVAPKPAIVLVDQFEELLKQYPQQALDWANVLTNQHVRFGLARVIFVVNSEKGTRTLLNLNQGDRFDVLVMPPADGKHVTGLDEELYQKCSRNIGLYKNVVTKLDAGEIDNVEEYASKKLRRWEDDFHIPYPYKYDPSWSDLAEKSLPLMKQTLLQALKQVLLAQKGRDSQPMLTPEKVEKQIEIATRCWETLDKMQVLDAMEAEWAEMLQGEGAKPAVAKSLAKHIRCLIGNPVPNEQGEGQGVHITMAQPRGEL